jgi:hypothetical protein
LTGKHAHYFQNKECFRLVPRRLSFTSWRASLARNEMALGGLQGACPWPYEYSFSFLSWRAACLHCARFNGILSMLRECREHRSIDSSWTSLCMAHRSRFPVSRAAEASIGQPIALYVSTSTSLKVQLSTSKLLR